MIVTDYRVFKSDVEERDLIKASEECFLKQMKSAVQRTIQSGHKIIFLSGPSCSGKTTSGRILCEEFEKIGKTVKEISIDDFFYGAEESERIAKEKGTEIDIESVAAIDLPYLRLCGEKILRGEEVMLPKFDFNSSSRVAYEKWLPTEDSIVIFEGIQAIYPEVLEIFKDEGSISLYIYPESHVSACGEVFTSDELRFFRRLVRDERSRNSPPERTFELWRGVRANEEKNIFPNVHRVDVQIDSSFAYEPYMIKERAVYLLKTLTDDSPYKEKADKMIEKFKNVPSITDRFLPEDSLFREFIGR